MTISEYKARLEAYRGDVRTPEDLSAFWRGKAETPVEAVTVTAVPFVHSGAVYETLTLSYSGGVLRARVIRPAAEGRHPLMLMFHDLHRGIRGWHHMTRFLALGYAVVALEAAPFAGDWKNHLKEIDVARRYREALILARHAASLPFVDPERVAAWGEGFGGGLAVAVAAFGPENIRCIALNPFPADLRSLLPGEDAASGVALDYLDLASFAPHLRAPALFGVCLMDPVAKPEGQYAIFNRLTCPHTLKVYPKYVHERVNFFENEILNFLQE